MISCFMEHFPEKYEKNIFVMVKIGVLRQFCVDKIQFMSCVTRAIYEQGRCRTRPAAVKLLPLSHRKTHNRKKKTIFLKHTYLRHRSGLTLEVFPLWCHWKCRFLKIFGQEQILTSLLDVEISAHLLILLHKIWIVLDVLI